MTILGISIGTTRTGVCVIKDDVLLDRHIHSYLQPWSNTKLRIITNRYKQHIVEHNVSAIIVKIPPLKKHTKPITLIIKRLEKLAKKYNCEFDLITKREMKDRTGIHSTDELIRYAELCHPELEAMFEKSVATDHLYFKKLYEAIVVAHIFQKRLQLKAQQMASTTE